MYRHSTGNISLLRSLHYKLEPVVYKHSVPTGQAGRHRARAPSPLARDQFINLYLDKLTSWEGTFPCQHTSVYSRLKYFLR